MRRTYRAYLLAAAVALLVPTTAATAAFQGQNGRLALSASQDIWTVRPDGTGAVNLTNTGGLFRNEEAPSWSPDGRRIAFQGSGSDGTNTCS